MTLISKTVIILSLSFIPHLVNAAPEVSAKYNDNNQTNAIIMRETIRYPKISNEMVRAIIYVESRGQTDAVSHKGAIGIMQIMPIALEEYNRVNKSVYIISDLYRKHINIRIGVWVYSRCLAKYPQRKVALFAYNAGKNRRWYDSGYAEKVIEALEGGK